MTPPMVVEWMRERETSEREKGLRRAKKGKKVENTIKKENQLTETLSSFSSSPLLRALFFALIPISRGHSPDPSTRRLFVFLSLPFYLTLHKQVNGEKKKQKEKRRAFFFSFFQCHRFFFFPLDGIRKRKKRLISSSSSVFPTCFFF